MGIIDFLQTKRSKKELALALAILREFRACESQAEWLAIPFAAWTKLEQFEEYLAHLAEGHPLRADTLEVLKRNPPPPLRSKAARMRRAVKVALKEALRREGPKKEPAGEP